MAVTAHGPAPTHTHKPQKTGGDDLDDGLDIDNNLVASDDENEDEDDDDHAGPSTFTRARGADADVEAEGEWPVMEEELGGVEGVKRKRSGDGEEGDDEGAAARARASPSPPLTEEERKRRKKQKIKDKAKERKAKRNAGDLATAPTSIPGTHLPTTTLLALLRASLIASQPSITPMELADRLPPESALLPPPEHQPAVVPAAKGSATNDKGDKGAGAGAGPTPDPALDPLRKRISGLLKKNGKVVQGRVRVVLLCLSGIRCADVVREVRGVRGDGQVAKLFAKHMKAAEQATYLAGNKVSIAVGTPARVGKLLSEGALQLDKTSVVLLDIGHTDSKLRTLLTLPEIRDELWRSVFAGAARDAILGAGVRVGAF